MRFRQAFLWIPVISLTCVARSGEAPSRWEDGLAPERVQEIFQTLRRSGGLDQVELNRAAVAGLLAGGRHGMELRKKAPAAEGKAPVIFVPPGAGAPLYVRPRGAGAEALAALDAALATHGKKEDEAAPPVLLLDLRAAGMPAAPAELAALMSRFVPAGAKLFAQDGESFSANAPASWEKPLWLLTDDTLSPEAELVGLILAGIRSPLLFGSETLGRAAPGREFPVDAETVLRVPAGVWTLADGSSTAKRKLTPSVVVPPNSEALARLLSSENPEETLTAAVRPRQNEAGLVAKENPEIPWRVSGFIPSPAADPVLQAAIDLCRARAVHAPAAR